MGEDVLGDLEGSWDHRVEVGVWDHKVVGCSDCMVEVYHKVGVGNWDHMVVACHKGKGGNLGHMVVVYHRMKVGVCRRVMVGNWGQMGVVCHRVNTDCKVCHKMEVEGWGRKIHKVGFH